ncbi:glycoside hydrolase family 16 protein [Hyaloscypha variabilis F]|uniref:Glycoside hydrolase family 16 protein n=1 Tax=Hyaloscypha variabilis (strain UAMH 11265 / GT02V1 / F) TaxID=1149755 RepID=A0A2J6SAS5_HYAVF|nr:glycoside hydrolase family 16 protein [Hyaloscypha variabilis F]
MRSFFYTLVLLSPVFASTVGSVVTETYQLDSRFAGATFLDNFDFFTGPDPTNGFVNYVTSSYASTWGLTRQLADGSVYIGVDYENILVPYGVGRDSVRISSTKSWGTGTLVVVDLAHVPGGQCGTWPAMWMLGSNWPYGGEIDIIEGVNSNVDNLMSLHTSPGCSVDSNIGQLGSQATTVCDTSVNSNSGCGVDSSDPRSYGTSFNTAGGGIYATQITPTSISIWFFPRTSIPSNLHDPATWGLPQAAFSGCDIESHFSNLSLVFDTTFCGDWAGAVWNMDEMCAKLDSEGCVDFVAGNPGAFGEAYWGVNFVEVYTLRSATATASSGGSTSTSVVGISTTSSSQSAKRSSWSSASSSFSPSSSSSKVHSSISSSGFGPTITKSTTSIAVSSTTSSFKSSSHMATTSSSASTSKKSSSSTKKSSSSTKIASTTSSVKHSSSSSKVASSSSSSKLSTSTSSKISSLPTTKKSTTSSLPSVLPRRSTQVEISSPSKHATLADSHPANSEPQTPTPSTSSNTYTTSTISNFSPYSTSPPPLNFPSTSTTPTTPPTLLTFTFLACLPSLLFPSPSANSTSVHMTLTLCLQSCQRFALAGVYDRFCFCSDSFLSLAPNSGEGICDLSCPGNGSQVCGGGGGGVGGRVKRDVGVGEGMEGVSLTVYRNLIPVKGIGAGGLGEEGGKGDSNSNRTVVGFQGAGRREETRWGIGCLVFGFGIVAAAL